MDALLYQKELLDIQRALQSQKEIFIDARIQLAGLMGGYPGGTTIGTTTSPGPTGMQSALGTAAVGTGILANLGGLFGYVK